ncbi:MAG: serine/threonine-protein kinase [Planctomycetota bacterium]
MRQELGAGGFGVVYHAEQIEPIRRPVALKIIKPGMDSKAVVARFEAERQALALMDHPYVARVYDGGATPQGRPYFAMELVNGLPLTTHCDRHKLDLVERVKLFADVCAAVQHAHSKGIIHRDLKPANILVEYENDKATPKVIDFGVAKALHQKLSDATIFTQQGAVIGTYEYMSPEQVENTGQDIDTRSDIYALGVILYELLTGTRPFDASDLRSGGVDFARRIIREVEPDRPSTRLGRLAGSVVDPDPARDIAETRRTDVPGLRRTLRRDLDWVVMRCLEKDRERRYATASDVAAELGRYLRNEPVLAGPPSTRYKLGKFIRRNRAGVAAGVAAALLVFAGLIGTGYGLVQAKQAQSRAEAIAIAEAKQRQEADTQREAAQAERAAAEAARDAERERSEELVAIATSTRLRRVNDVVDTEPGLAKQLLADSAVFPSERRNFAWRYLSRRLTTRQVWRARGHNTPALGLAATPDGSAFATSARDGTVVVWEARTGDKRFDLGPYDSEVNALAISPDGSRLCVGVVTGLVVIVDIATGQPLAQHQLESCSSVAFSPDGRWLAVGQSDGTLRLSPSTDPGTLVRQWRAPGLNEQPTGWLSAMAFSPDSQRLLGAVYQGHAWVWSLDEPDRPIRSHAGLVTQTLDWCPTGKRYAVVTFDGAVHCFNAETGETEFARTYEQRPISLRFTPEGKHILLSCLSQDVISLDAGTGEVVAQYGVASNRPQTVAPVGREGWFAVTDWAGYVRLWDTRRPISGRGAPSPVATNARIVMRSIADLRVVREGDPVEVAGVQRGMLACIRRTHPHDHLALVTLDASGDPRAHLYTTGRRIREVWSHRLDTSPVEISLSPDASHLALHDNDTLEVWRVADSSRIARYELAHASQEIEWTDNATVAVVSNGRIRLLHPDAPDRDHVLVVDGHPQLVTANLAEGSLVSGRYTRTQADGTVSVTGAVLHLGPEAKRVGQFGSNHVISGQHVSDDASLIASHTAQAAVYRLDTGARLSWVRATTGYVTTLAFNEDASLLAVGRHTGEVGLWHPRGHFLFNLTTASGHVAWLSFTNNGRTLLAGVPNGDGSADVVAWDS